ncbi:SDR family NAD(P)-dependent oxidoreductase [Protaetiibacter mangrovi]|uniref:SDR family oxidoreductase n=1 Tax=Protaetiibacter mangrovi TaxID=2970926 RepID=A0ABT1ZBF9_9MICO|nr:SDR family NAD(P)-dependent oxidoreductase [Protaetiibacter mangrovi]MCS0498030.1 SDR family oxidoreductase [Protaetiibacter mangrovi]TPW98382.1 NAD(P)-dependent oxidoreductase [Schumannella luteola]
MTAPSETSLAGRVALVTGAAHGQGRAIARALAEDGAAIVALDVGAELAYPAYAQGTTAELETLVAEILEAGGRAIPALADVRDAAAVQRTVDAAVEAYGRLDIVVNNAGIVAYAELETMTDAEWDAMIGINLTGPFVVARAAVPHLKRAGHGVIVNNSSVMGLRGGDRLSHYVASKHGLTGLTKAWAIELAPFGVRVVSIHPTGVDTPMNDGLAALEGATPREIAERSAGNLLPGVPWIETADVAELVRYLVSDRARYATGAQFVIDAGLLTR